MVSPWVSLYYCAHYVEGDTEAYSDELAKDTQPVRGRAQTKPIPYLPAPLSVCQHPFGCLSRLLRNPHPLRQARVFNHLNMPQGPLTVLSSSSQHPLTHASSLTRIRRGSHQGFLPPSLCSCSLWTTKACGCAFKSFKSLPSVFAAMGQSLTLQTCLAQSVSCYPPACSLVLTHAFTRMLGGHL